MGADAFVTGHENVVNAGLGKAIKVPFDRFAVSFGKGKDFDTATGSEPFDKLIGPVFDEGTGTNDNDALGSGFAPGGNSCLEQCVNQGDRLQSLAQTHVC